VPLPHALEALAPPAKNGKQVHQMITRMPIRLSALSIAASLAAVAVFTTTTAASAQTDPSPAPTSATSTPVLIAPPISTAESERLEQLAQQEKADRRAAAARAERQWSIQRPSRGASRTAAIIVRAATVPRSIRPWAECVVNRESGGTLDRIQSGVGARNPNSSASGKFQFLDNAWRRGLSFMVRDRLVEFGMPKRDATKVRQYLGARPISQWHGYYQTIGFVEVVSRGGRFHWNGPGC
jgi:hypothetical protein